MRLKKLIVQGFKSFADRTEFSFDSPITGIVGPNGCGKSNVVDAFKWVLGEQSAKSLRGDAMMDVIFNGSSARKPSGMAEVTLVFENPPRADGTRVIGTDTDEVFVGRRLFRDGTSEYQVNNSSSRLKDVRELFLDTGVGVDAYSVIEQGKVAALLEANPEERRLIFEEAAGISKFKARKKETQRKLEKVEQNLLRVNDITEEVDKRLRSVKIQAGKARNFQELSLRMTELRLKHSLHEFHVLSGQRQQHNVQHEDAKFRLDDVSGDLASSQNSLATKKESLESLTQTRQKLEYELVQARAQIQSARQQQQYCSQQIQQIGEQIAAFERDREEATSKKQQATELLETQTKELASLNAELNEQRQLIEQRQRAYSDGQLELNSLASSLDKQKAAILDLMRKLSGVSSRLGAIEIERKNATLQQQRLEQRQAEVNGQIQTLESARSELQSRLEFVGRQIETERQQLEVKRADAAALGKEITQVGESLGSAREHRSGLLSRQKLLADMEAKREGVSEGVKSVLRQRETAFPFIRGLVADVLRVDIEHAHVIEAALDGRDQHLVTNEQESVFKGLETFQDLEGRVTVISTDALTDNEDSYDWNLHPHRIRKAIDLVRFEPSDAPLAIHLLGKTIVVDDLATAADLLKNGPRGYRYVTLSGEVLESNGILRVGPLTAAMGLLSRRSELDALVQQISEVDSRISELGQRLAEGNNKVHSLEEDIGSLRNAVYQSNTVKVELQGSLAQNSDRCNSLKREQPILKNEISGISAQMEKLAAEEAALLSRLSELEGLQTAANSEVQRLSELQKSTAENLSRFSEELTAARVQLGQVQEKQLACGQAVQRHQGSLAELEQQMQRLTRSGTALADRQKMVEHELQVARHQEATFAQGVTSNESRSTVLAEEISRLGQIVSEISTKVDSCRNRREEIEQELHDIELKSNELRVRIESLVQRTREEMGIEIESRYLELSAAGNSDEPAEMDWDAIAEEIRQLREKIQRLGNVNVEAIGELEELEKRQQFLSAQMTDLSTSKTQLNELISQINTESGVRFEQTFNAVREHFQGMFRKLFGGGKADIFLETELDPPKNAPMMIGPDGQPMPPQKITVDILDAGIEIIARPPGKQPVSISQLSGGEKTMTCVALLLSIFKSKPSPFCILDEVDAALDEANNQRFNLIIQEFLDQSQFIVITHSKRTMQIADTLYGVTMQEQGVSKRVAVKFDQVDAQGRIDESVTVAA